MCAICGFVFEDSSHPVDTDVLSRMRDSLHHRGPDDAGVYVGAGVGLGSRRLAILDLSERGHMPMCTDDRRYWITYNGEIYNYQELRSPLEAKGVRFRSNTDTEVLLKLYVAEGPAMLDKLNGMFAFAIWDALERRLVLARDRLGIKPLFYTRQGRGLCFASEEKALFAAGVDPRFDHSVWSELLCFRYVAGEKTPFKEVQRLLPGHYLTWQHGEVRIHRWWNLVDRARAHRAVLPRNPDEWYRETFDDAIRLRRISDVPVGVLLSGGLDSSTVAASLARQAGQHVASFTVGFPPPHYDERSLARELAGRYALEQNEIEVPSDRIPSQLRTAAGFNDEPLAHASDPHLLAISQHAKSRVTVLLSGEGADETLGGYVRYRPLRHPGLLLSAAPVAAQLQRVLPGPRRLRKLLRFLDLRSPENFVLYNACDVFPGQLRSLGLTGSNEPPEFRSRMVAEASRLYPRELMRQAMYSDQHTFLCSVLDRNDRMTMGASIECRVPFLDYRLVEMLAALPTNVLFHGSGTKPLLRRSLGGRLPTAILQHRKWGFGVPWKTYLREVPELHHQVEALPRHELIQESPFDRPVLAARVRAFLAGDDELAPFVLALLMTTQARDTLRDQPRVLSFRDAQRDGASVS